MRSAPGFLCPQDQPEGLICGNLGKNLLASSDQALRVKFNQTLRVNFIRSDAVQPPSPLNQKQSPGIPGGIASKISGRAGLTLIELIIALFLTILLIGVTITIYQSNSRYYYQQQAILEQEQNLRTALYIMARDVRMAGDGLKVMGVSRAQAYVENGATGSWYTYEVDSSGTLAGATGLMAVYGVDNNDATDTLTVFRSEVESSTAFGQLLASFIVSDGNLQFTSAIPDGMVEPGDILGVVYADNAVLVEAETITNSSVAPGVITLGDRFKPSSGFPGGISFPSGSYVYNLRDVSLTTYWVDTANHNLMARLNHLTGIEYDRDDLASVIIATGIEDLQVRYVLNDDEPSTGQDGLAIDDLLTGRFVRQVNIGLVGRSAKSISGLKNFQPINLFNHNAATGVSDGYPRQVVTTMVNLRNY
ncbi:MAG: PilW family protein [Deltaproteobacteria bacterium]|jgi:type II secretory pathway pseudopilin PulG|nr:PilW family protein [Deltaproteobacteria bacterium]